MKILVDAKEIPTPDSAGTLNQVVTEISKDLSPERKMVTGVVVDGEPVLAATPEDWDRIDLSAVETVEISTGSIDDISLQVLKSCADGIPRLIEAFCESADHLQGGRRQEGLTLSGKAFAFWSEILEGIQTALIGRNLDFNAVVVPAEEGEDDSTGATAGDVLERINSLLAETQKAFEEEDTLEIGDILQYDLPLSLRSFQRALYQLTEEAK